MKWLTLDYIKEHSRIDYNDVDDILELYGENAEDVVLTLCNRSYEDLMNEYGEVPKSLWHAALIIVDITWQTRIPFNKTNMYQIPVTVDLLVKPYTPGYMHGKSRKSDNSRFSKFERALSKLGKRLAHAQNYIQVLKSIIIKQANTIQCMETSDSKVFLTVPELSAYTGWSRSKIYKKTSCGEIPFSKQGRNLIFNLFEIEALIKMDELIAQEKTKEKAQQIEVKKLTKEEQKEVNRKAAKAWLEKKSKNNKTKELWQRKN